jgi:23S rRNA (cytosine1962-C5)-methyltransferase
MRTLQKLLPDTSIYERSDIDIRNKEGLKSRTGTVAGNNPPDLIEIQENDCRFLIDIKQGHKTGFYLDQRNNREHLKKFCSGAEVLNCFAYTGAFGIIALQSGAASIVNIDSSAGSLSLGRQNLELNHLNSSQAEDIEGNAFQVLRQLRATERKFDLIVLDPPKFIESRAQLNRATRGYKDINMLAFQLLRPGGHLFTFSCSGLLEPALFQKIVADAALDAGCDAQLIAYLNQAEDHPIAMNFPEGHYLKGLICRTL